MNDQKDDTPKPRSGERPKSRRPESWPPLVLKTVILATQTEVLIPFESIDRVREFKKILHDIRRSFREHSHPSADDVNILKAIQYKTYDIMSERPKYRVDSDLYPYTICLSPALGLTTNLESALEQQTHSPYPSIPNSPPVEISRETLEKEIASVMRETALEDDANEIANFYRSRKK